MVTGIFAVLVLLFLSKATDGFILLEKTEYIKIIFVVLFFVLSIALWNESRAKYLTSLGIALVILGAAHLYFVEPKKLSPENISVRETAEFVDTITEAKGKEKLSNHTFIMFYSKGYKDEQTLWKKLDLKNLNAAPKGSYVIWESHYGYRPEFKNDVQLDVLRDSTKYKFVKQLISQDQRFGSFIFEKQ